MIVYLKGAVDEQRLEEQLIESLRAADFADVAQHAMSGKRLTSLEEALDEAYLGKAVLFLQEAPEA